jgi:hypothetical protein
MIAWLAATAATAATQRLVKFSPVSVWTDRYSTAHLT